MTDAAPAPASNLPPPAADDLAWAKALKFRVGRSLFREQADARIADELAKGIKSQNAWRVHYLLTTPLPSLFTRHPSTPDVETVFETAYNNLGEDAQQITRQKFPALYDAARTTPLLFAVIQGFEDVADLLLQRGAQPFLRSETSPTGYDGPIAAAIYHGNYPMVSKLMAQPAVQQELAEKPAFRNYLLLTALGTDCQATLDHLAKCDPELLEKGRVYGDRKASEFTLGEGVLARRRQLREDFDRKAKDRPPVKGMKPAPLYRPRQAPRA